MSDETADQPATEGQPAPEGQPTLVVNAQYVKDLSFDLVAKDFSIIIKAKADKEITVDSKNVKVVGDVILLTVAAETFETPVVPATPAKLKVSPPVSSPAKPSPPRHCKARSPATARSPAGRAVSLTPSSATS